MIRAKKHLGQHFLKNEKIAADIAAALTGDGYDQVLEVGPGMGVLTRFLLKRPGKLFVVEIDTESVEYLLEHFEVKPEEVIEGDFLKLPLHRLFKKPVAVVGNFPYNISSQIVFKVLENRSLVPEMVGMFQKEVAERIVAGPGSKAYGILSVLTAAFYEREYLFTVEADQFSPPPKVRSGVIRLKARKSYELPCDEKKLRAVVKTAFNQRRKTLKNALATMGIAAKMDGHELLGKRAEQIGLEDFIYITNSL